MLGEAADLFEEAVGHLLAVPGGDALIETLALGAQPDLHIRHRRVVAEPWAVGRERLPAADGDLQGSDYPSAVGRLHAPGRHRIECSQLPVQCLGVGFGLEFSTHLRVAPRYAQLVDDGAHIQTRAAHKQRHRTTASDLVDHRNGLCLQLGHCELVAGIHEVDEMVRHLGLLSGGGRRGADVHAAVDLHGVEADDLSRPDPAGHVECEGRLARCGGPDDHQRPLGQPRSIRRGQRCRCGLGRQAQRAATGMSRRACETLSSAATGGVSSTLRSSPLRKFAAAAVTSTLA